MSGARRMPTDELLEQALAARASRVSSSDVLVQIEAAARRTPQTTSRLPLVIAVRRAPIPWAPDLGGRIGVPGRLAMVMIAALLATLLIATGVLVGSRALDADPMPRPKVTGDLVVPRELHTATLLPDARVLLVGGMSLVGPDDVPLALASAEVWDPATGTFALTGSLSVPRAGHTATLLRDGRVLVVGRETDGYGLEQAAYAEVWDPTTGSFSQTGPLVHPRNRHSATLLPDGTVLIAGGEDLNGPISSVESWDPATGEFSPVGSLIGPRYDHTASALPDGRILVIGGDDATGQATASAELWDPASRTSHLTGSLAERRRMHTATVLADGSVLVVSGSNAGIRPDLISAERWDPRTEAFALAGTLPNGREGHTATLLPDGMVLIAGGLTAPPHNILAVGSELWEPGTESFEAAPALAQPRTDHTATLLPTGQILFVGGWSNVNGPGAPTAGAELYDTNALVGPVDASEAP
jgi:Galactose oxidase, central domain